MATASIRSRRRRHQARVRAARIVLLDALGHPAQPQQEQHRGRRPPRPAASAPGPAPRTTRTVMHSARPTTLSMASAARRWNWPGWQPDGASAGDDPQQHELGRDRDAGRGRPRSAARSAPIPAPPATDEQHRSWVAAAEARRVPSQRTSRRAASDMRARMFSNSRLPSRPASSRGARPRRCLERSAKRR